MDINLQDFVKEEPPKCYEESYYHLSGIHICKEFSKNLYYVIPNNEFRNIADIDIYKKNREKHNSFESALKETNEIVQFANTRGAQDARFIQKRRGSNYKVNSSDDSEEEKIESKVIEKTKTFSRLFIDNKNIKEFNLSRKRLNTDKLSSLYELNNSEDLIFCEFFESIEELPITLEKDFQKVIKITSYELVSDLFDKNGIESTKKMPTSWELYGKCENKNWFVLDSQKNIKKWSPNEARLFNLNNSSKKISQIRLVIRQTEDGRNVSIKKLKINTYKSIKEISLKKLIYLRKTLRSKMKRYKKLFNRYFFYRIYEKAKNSTKLNPIRNKLTFRQKKLIKNYSKLLFKLLDKKYYIEKIGNIIPKKRKELSSCLISYNNEGFENYFLTDEIEPNEKLQITNSQSDSFVFLANESASTNELTAELKSHNIIKLNQKLYCVVKQGISVQPDELESGKHIKNEDIATFTNEKDAVDWIYSNLKNEEVGISIDKSPILIDTLVNHEDVGIENYLYFYQSIYILIPSFYGITERAISNELSDLKIFKEKYSQISIADDKDFIKEIFKTRDTMPENYTYKKEEYTFFKDNHCMLLRNNLKKLNYDLLNIESISQLSNQERESIRELILEFDKEESLVIKNEKNIIPKFNIINQIGEMFIIENEGYYIAIKQKYIENFPDNDYINDIKTRYDLSISVIEDYCKSLL